ncbi:hypothetical protein SELMODRAFT_423793 [Selaginella moellendorffii]|uniref:Uncharacterized protein n=1 Tax=Selaginella moellendorffii TaxID=88036 RepID=D8SMV8_SELML|nr:hypothetical protein SELMODRAFT_423793 [Selaginella moellendorffii]
MSGTAYQGSSHQCDVITSGYFVGVSSAQEVFEPDCCSFQGSFQKLDLRTGEVLWRTSMLPEGSGFTGAAVWGSSPPIEKRRRLIYIATGNLYTAPREVEECEAARATNTTGRNPDDPFHHESVVALDLDSGEICWAARLGELDVWR